MTLWLEQVVNNAAAGLSGRQHKYSGDNAADTILTSTTLTDEVVVDPVAVASNVTEQVL